VIAGGDVDRELLVGDERLVGAEGRRRIPAPDDLVELGGIVGDDVGTDAVEEGQDPRLVAMAAAVGFPDRLADDGKARGDAVVEGLGAGRSGTRGGHGHGERNRLG